MSVSSLIRLESNLLQVDVFPGGGGKLVSIYNKELGYEFLWRNEALQLKPYPEGTEYDPVFFGGVDELLPNDIPERVDGMAFPDHGELWTAALEPSVTGDRGLQLQGQLPVSKLRYEKKIYLDKERPVIVTDYRITNGNNVPVKFLWKLHAALNIDQGDRINCSAKQGQVVDLEYSRFQTIEPFAWPVIDGEDVSTLPAKNGGMDFFYLYDLSVGQVAWHRPSDDMYFAYQFDRSVFPYVWLFASYGGFLGHYMAILEPCTSMPISVNDAALAGTAVVLQPGETLATQVSMVAGKLTDNLIAENK